MRYISEEAALFPKAPLCKGSWRRSRLRDCNPNSDRCVHCNNPSGGEAPSTHRRQQPLRRKSATSPCTGEARYICNSLPRQASLYINSSRGSGGAATAAAQGRWICAFLTARGGWLRCSCKLRGRSQGCRPGRRPDTIRRSRPRSRARR